MTLIFRAVPSNVSGGTLRGRKVQRLKRKVTRPSETSGNTDPTTCRHVPKYFNPQQNLATSTLYEPPVQDNSALETYGQCPWACSAANRSSTDTLQQTFLFRIAELLPTNICALNLYFISSDLLRFYSGGGVRTCKWRY